MKQPTIKDVAARAGVSYTTVSHIINGTRSVSKHTREKVNLAIAELSYTPNVMARNFKIGKRNTIGFIVPDISNIFFSAIIEGVEAELSTQGYNLIVANTKETPQREVEHIRTLATGLVDGLIIASTLEDYGEISAVLPQGFPVLIIDRGIKNCQADQVLLSCESAVRQGVAELIVNGHTRIGFIASMERLSTTAERLIAYRSELKEQGIEPDDSLVCYTDSMAVGARSKAINLLNSGCTAIVACNNMITMNTINAVLQYQKDTGKTCDVLGYSYGEWYSWLPNLKTIVVPTREAGRIAGHQILQRIEEPLTSAKEIILTSMYSRI